TLGSEAGVPVVYDLGSGSLVAPGAGGLASEPLVRPALASGVDLVCFSGDKLLGGPQAGIVAGRREAVERCRRHPLFRALRPGRLVYTALEATLRLYARGEETAIPVLRAMRADPLELRRAAQRLARSFSKLPGVDAYAEPSEAQAGSGSLPTVTLPSWAVRLEVAGLSSTELARRLRQGEPAVMARIEDGAVLLDLRSLGPGEPAEVVGRVRALA
nr:L-seryl-tRNA(Sec) selenium transferase [Thermoanaerobaculia bacterium]